MRDVIRSTCDQADISLELAGNFKQFNGDRVQWREVFVNLLQNAVQVSEQKACITITGHQESDLYQIQVADSGPGIDPDYLEKVFSPYFTRRQHGTGLGLAVVRRILQMHNGDISVTSPPGEGAIFSIEIRGDI